MYFDPSDRPQLKQRAKAAMRKVSPNIYLVSVVCLLLTTAAEAVTKKKIDPKYEGYLHSAGMIALLGLMALIMFKDIFVLIKG